MLKIQFLPLVLVLGMGCSRSTVETKEFAETQAPPPIASVQSLETAESPQEDEESDEVTVQALKVVEENPVQPSPVPEPRNTERTVPPQKRRAETVSRPAPQETPGVNVPVQAQLEDPAPNLISPVEEDSALTRRAAVDVEVENDPEPAVSHPAPVVVPPPPRRQAPAPVIIEPASPPAVPEPVIPSRIVPEGTPISIRLAETISTETHRPGDAFVATLDEDLMGETEVIVSRGAEVQGEILALSEPGKVKGRASMTFVLRSIQIDGETYPIETSEVTLEAESSKGRDVAAVGAATAIGAILGGVFGGKKGAAVGAATGAGAGSAGVLLTKGQHVRVEKERLFSFRLEQPLEVGSR